MYIGINAHVTLEDAHTEREDRARILKQNSQNVAKSASKHKSCYTIVYPYRIL